MFWKNWLEQSSLDPGKGVGSGGKNIQNKFINQCEPLQPPLGIGLTCLQSVGIGTFHQNGES